MNLTKAFLFVLGAVVLIYLDFAPVEYLTFAVVLCYYLLLAVGWNIVGGVTYLASFAQAAFATLAAYISAMFVTYTGSVVPVGMAVGIIAVIAISYGLGYITLRMGGAYLALATIAFSESVRVWLTVNESLTGGAAGYFPAPLIPGGTPAEYCYLFVGVTITSIYFTYRLLKSKRGVLMKAVGNDEEAASALGVNVRAIRLFAFTLSGLFAAIGGVLFAHYLQVIVPADGSLMEQATIMAGPIVGGLGTIFGPVIGTLIIIGARDIIRTYLGPYDVLFFGIIMIVSMKFARNGIVGMLTSPRVRSFGRRVLSRTGEPFRKRTSATNEFERRSEFTQQKGN